MSNSWKLDGELRPIGTNVVLVVSMEQGEQKTAGGIILTDDNMKDRGIRPRWCKVWKTSKDVSDVKEGDWLLIEHGRWSRGLPLNYNGQEIYLQKIDWPNGALLHSLDEPTLADRMNVKAS